MDINPLNSNDTIKFSATKQETNAKELNKKAVEDPLGVVPKGAYRVFALEGKLLIAHIIFWGVILLFLGIGASLYFTNSLGYLGVDTKKWTWTWLIIPIAIGLFSFYKFFASIINFSSIRRSLKIYRSELRKDVQALPSAIARLFKKITFVQIKHNWLTIFFVFYTGLAAFLIWILQDKKFLWDVLNFEKWIHALTPNPDFLALMMAISIGVVLVIWIVLTLFRRGRTNDIAEYFGFQIEKDTNIEEIKSKKNKFYLKLFLLSIAIVTIIPIIAALIIKRFVLGRKK
ncbi:MSC_0882 family membrane protein [Mycoplasma procyoni]|uniref:MSC_0882 family membrane protein n=1 Tax=Mycoplasma procyoni TaxID=568784 RepID=UPI00197C3FDA|nr:hypothetical protein [Mycoplasma procyoni]MBN3534936.1 hypothetical protein [Mycoplasma procyoni]